MTGTLHEDQYTFLIISRSVLLRMKYFLDKFVEKIKTHVMSNLFFFFFENRSVYEIMWKYMVRPDRPKITV